MSTKFWIGAGILAAATVLAPWAMAGEQRMEKKVIVMGGPSMHGDIADKITINDVDTLAIGETRSYTSPSGKQFTLTRDADEHWTLRGEGKEFGFGGAPEDIEGEGNVIIHKKVIVLDGDSEPGEAQIHTLSGGEGDKRVQVFVDKSGDGEPTVQKILINGQEAAPGDDNVRIIVKKMEGGDGQPHAVWISKDGSQHEGLPDHGVMMIETEDFSHGGGDGDATMVEIVRESGGDHEKRVEKRVFLFVSDGEDN